MNQAATATNSTGRPAFLGTRLSLMMFLEFFIWGIWFVPLWKYCGELGFSSVQTGAAYGTTAIAAMISPLLVGMIADRFVPSQMMLGLLHLVGGVIMWIVAGVTDWSPFYALLLVYTLCYMPTLALVNSVSFENMADPKREFPPVRTLGTIGWIVSGLMIGSFFYAAAGGEFVFQLPEFLSGKGTDTLNEAARTALPFKICAIASFILGLYCFTLPHTPPKLKGANVSLGDVLGLKALSLMKDRNVFIFVLCSFLVCIPLAFYYQSANGFVAGMGMENSEWKMTYGQFSEIFFLLLVPFFFRKLGVKWMLAIGMACWAIRYFIFSAAGPGDMALLYAGIILHGICYDFFFVTGQLYIDAKAPRDIRASAQGFIAFVTLGVGLFIGNMVNGFWATKQTSLVDGEKVLNWSSVWMLPAILAVGVLILFVFTFKNERAEEI